MHALLSTLVATSLLLHAAFGCCWHQHASHSREGPRIPAAVESVCHQQVHGCCDHEHGRPSPVPCKDGPHCQGDCNYLAIQKSQLDQVQIVAPLELAAIALPSYDVHNVAIFGLDRLYELDTGPPLRLHLVHQILLI